MTSLIAEQLLLAFSDPDNKQEAKRLLSTFPDPSEIRNIKTIDSVYLVHKAADHGWTDIVELLVATYHCNPNCTNYWGQTSLHDACVISNQLPTVKLLTTQYCLDPLQVDSIGRTPLHYCRGETLRYLQQIIGKCVCLYVYCLYICTLLKYSAANNVIYNVKIQ